MSHGALGPLRILKDDLTTTGDYAVILSTRIVLFEDIKWTANRSRWPNFKGWRSRFQGFKVSSCHQSDEQKTRKV